MGVHRSEDGQDSFCGGEIVRFKDSVPIFLRFHGWQCGGLREASLSRRVPSVLYGGPVVGGVHIVIGGTCGVVNQGRGLNAVVG